MSMRILAATLAVAIAPQLAAAQAATTTAPAQPAAQPAAPVANPVSTAFRDGATKAGKNLMDAAADMPADRYGFKPTAAQMSFADIMVHLAQGNDFLCGKVSGVAAPTRTKVAATAGKDALVARLRETFAFCDQALASLDDSKLGEQMSLFGPRQYTRAETMFITIGDWADHYSQVAIYMRLNNLVPPTAKKKPAA
jgi:uncharacterized damage-inducible protein DinB